MTSSPPVILQPGSAHPAPAPAPERVRFPPIRHGDPTLVPVSRREALEQLALAGEHGLVAYQETLIRRRNELTAAALAVRS
jgi:hypothetical protein